jgi:FHS family L-fucose permease-like MFS transporter
MHPVAYLYSMQLRNSNVTGALPVFMAYIVMGFVDIVGVSTGYIKKDFELADKVAQLIPSMALVWFFILSVPTGLLLEKYGKRIILNIGMFVTGLGMLIPFLHYSFPVMLIAFIFLGIGNTIVQVSANPLLHDVVPAEKYTSYMSLAQFIKAICSLLGPIIATFMAVKAGNWKLVFLVYAAASFLAVLWLYLTNIREEKMEKSPASFKSCFSLLGNRFILLMVIGIFMLVGVEVGMNSNIANFLQARYDISLESASLGISIFFTAVMIGRFLGAILLQWISSKKFFVYTTILAISGIIELFISRDLMLSRICIFIIGFGLANLFPIIFATAVEKMPNRINEISGLMIMAIAGGAFLPPVMGLVSTLYGVLSGFFVLLIAMLYILVISVYTIKAKNDQTSVEQ